MATAEPTLESLTLERPKVVGGDTVGGTVTLTSAAPQGGAVVALACDSADVECPPSVAIPAGTTEGDFEVATLLVNAPTHVQVTATYGGTHLVAPLELVPAVTVSSLALDPATVTGGTSAQATATLSGPAPAGGVTLTFQSTSTSIVPPTGAAVPAGATTATFAVQTQPVAAEVDGYVFALYGGSSAPGPLTVEPPVVQSLAVAPATVVGGNPATGTVTLNGPAPSGGRSVTLGSSNPVVASVPATVVVAAGQTTATFAIVTTGVAAELPATVTAASTTAPLTVEPAALASLTAPSPLACPTFTATVTLTGFAPPGGAPVTLTALNSLLQPPSPLTVPAGQASATVVVGATPVTTRTSTGLVATYLGVTLNAPVILDPALVSVGVDPSSIDESSSGQVTVTVTLAGPAPDGGATVSINSTSDPSWWGSQVQGSVVVPAGSASTQAPFTVSVPDDPQEGGYLIWVSGSYEGSSA